MSKDLMIDVAVLCQEYTQVDYNCNNANIVNLDPIDITEETFRHIFYPYGENFGMDKNVKNSKNIDHYITFLAPHRTLRNGKKFFLLDEIITNIETDLNISRNAFTTTSLIDLTNDLSKIKSLLDINCCSVLSSLTWQNVLEVIENYKLVNYSDESIIPVCVVNIVFKTPTTDVKNTTIRFNYKITNY
jgi:hypothetical protein